MGGDAMFARPDEDTPRGAASGLDRFPEEWQAMLVDGNRADQRNPRTLEPWDPSDLALLPDASRYDGDAFLFPTAATDPRVHTAANSLRRLLDRHFLFDPDSSDLAAVRKVGIRLATSVVEPDLSVIRRSQIDWHAHAQPASAAVLVVEVVPLAAGDTDHTLNAERYARAGIPHYWRITVDPTITVTAHAWRDGSYVPVGDWIEGETVTMDGPVQVQFDPGMLRA